MKLKYQIAVCGTGVLLVLIQLFLRRRAPGFVTNFVTAQTAPINLAMFRVVFFIVLGSSFSVANIVWFSSIPEVLRFPPQGLGWLVEHLPINETWAWIASVSLLFFCVTAAIGLFTRLSAVLCLILGFYVLGIPQFYGKINHYHHLLWFTAILAASPCADVLSVDAILSSWKRADKGVLDPPSSSKEYALPLRFVWLSMGVIYFSAGFWKVWTSGYKWAFSDNPKVMMYNKWMELGGWRPILRIDHYPFLYQMSAAVTIVFELSFIVIIFFPAIRFLAPLGGLIFHNMTNLFMRISFWQLQVCYVAFLDWDRHFRSLGKRLFREEVYLIYDGDRKLHRFTVASLETIDILRRVTYVNLPVQDRLVSEGILLPESEYLVSEIQLVVRNTRFTGFGVCRAVVKRFPVLWPLLPFLYLWPFSMFGALIYRNLETPPSNSVHAASEKKFGVEPNPKRRGAVVLVGGFVLYASILSAVGKIQSWPLAGYPTFEDIDPPEVSVITMSVEDRSGLVREVRPVSEQTLNKMPSERFMALLGRVLSTDNESLRRERLKALWLVWTWENTKFQQATVVRFYRETLSSLPERQNDNPLDRSLLYELRF